MNAWVQMNVALDRKHGPALSSARQVFAALGPLLDDCRTDGRLRRFHFMRKPPDIRLRLEGPAPHDELVPPVEAVLRRLADHGVVVDFFTSIYEPEERLFGGPQAMSLVHDHFDVDSRAWIDHDRLQAVGVAKLPAEDLTTAVLNELFALSLDDRGEVWDTWCNLRALVTSDASDRAGAAPTVRFPEHLTDLVSVEEQEVLARYRAVNQHLAAGLRRLWSSGQLQSGRRALLPFVGVFHFHRYGLDARRQAAQAVAMTRAWDPRRGMQGVE